MGVRAFVIGPCQIFYFISISAFVVSVAFHGIPWRMVFYQIIQLLKHIKRIFLICIVTRGYFLHFEDG